MVIIKIRFIIFHTLLSVLFAVTAVAGTDNPEKKEEESKQKTIAGIAKNSDLIEGLFPLYQDQKSGEVYMLIREDQLDKEYIHLLQLHHRWCGGERPFSRTNQEKQRFFAQAPFRQNRIRWDQYGLLFS